jgi:hypothetical protein
MLGYAREFGLTLEDVEKQPGEIFYYFDGQRYSEAVVVDEYRNFVAAMRADLLKISAAPTADKHTDADVLFDNTTLLEYLETRKAGNVIKKAIAAAYMSEFGLELHNQSCLNFLCLSMQTRDRSLPHLVFLAMNVTTLLAATSKLPKVYAISYRDKLTWECGLLKLERTPRTKLSLHSRMVCRRQAQLMMP